MKLKRRIILSLVVVSALTVISVVICDRIVAYAGTDRLYDDVRQVPHRKVGLVLGTSPVSTWTGKRNHHFDQRIKAAADLYKAGKVERLVVSGGDYRNTENGFDEPAAMRDSLMAQGVDSLRIILDYDGTRTLNSIAKMRDVYHHDSIIIISQKYHNERALYQAKHLGIDAIGFNAGTPYGMGSIVWWRNQGREVLARVKLFLDIACNKQPDLKESVVSHHTAHKTDDIVESHLKTPYGDLICLKPDMSKLRMDMVCGGVPSPDDDSIVLAFAGAFTGTSFYKGHANIAGDHVSEGKRFKGYQCKRNTGAFTWSAASGPRFIYQNYSADMDKAASEGGMAFAQEMMIHDGRSVKTTRPLDNRNVFRALCLDSNGDLALYESQRTVTFGNFINALQSQKVKEAIYTDMGPGWNYCFYRLKSGASSPKYLHNKSLPFASNFIILRPRSAKKVDEVK